MDEPTIQRYEETPCYEYPRYVSLEPGSLGDWVQYSDLDPYVAAKVEQAVQEERKRCSKINLNVKVLVRVTDYGRSIFAKHYHDLGLDQTTYWKMYEQSDGRLEMHLWTVMNIFGASCYNGCRAPIETTVEIMPDPLYAAVRAAQEQAGKETE